MSTETTNATALDLDAIEARANAATDGPWEHGGNDGLVWPQRIGDPVSGSTEMPDADFIAAARTDVPALAAEVRRLRAELTECQRHLNDERTTVGQLRQDLREADDNYGFLQQHLENVRNGDA